jgi:Putative hemolysin
MNGLHRFEPKVRLNIEIGPFILKTATSIEELKEALLLRYQVFHREMIGKTKEFGIDVDEYDLYCDHLIIVEKRTGKVVGTYRMNCSSYAEQFYSEREFSLQKIMSHPGIKIELGRACIHKDHRRGLVISLLWRGIAEYMMATKADLLFGCASIKTQDPREAGLLYRYFEEQGRLSDQYSAPPKMMYAMPGFDFWLQEIKLPLSEAEREEAETLLPPLCRAYMKAGAFIGGAPAWDWEFKCIDFLTILQRDDLNKSLWKRLKIGSVES